MVGNIEQDNTGFWNCFVCVCVTQPDCREICLKALNVFILYLFYMRNPSSEHGAAMWLKLPYFFYVFDHAKYSINPHFYQNNYFCAFKIRSQFFKDNIFYPPPMK